MPGASGDEVVAILLVGKGGAMRIGVSSGRWDDGVDDMGIEAGVSKERVLVAVTTVR